MSEKPELQGINYLPKPPKSYVDWAHMGELKPWAPLACDNAKANLVWLVHPAVEEGFHTVPETLLEGLTQHFDSETRKALCQMPKKFLEYWENLPPQEYVLHYFLPDGYEKVMQEQVQKAQDRLLGRSEVGNVVSINFRHVA